MINLKFNILDKKRIKKQGYSLFEVLIAVAVVTVFYFLIYTMTRASILNYYSTRNYLSISYITFGASNFLSGATETQLTSITNTKSVLDPLKLSATVTNNISVSIDAFNRTITCTMKGETFTCKIP